MLAALILEPHANYLGAAAISAGSPPTPDRPRDLELFIGTVKAIHVQKMLTFWDCEYQSARRSVRGSTLRQ